MRERRPARWTAGDRTLVILISAGLLLTIALGVWKDRGGALPAQSICVSVVVFGTECPGCGLTRGFIELGRGELAAARALNPLAPALLAGAFALLLLRIAKLFTDRPIRWHRADLVVAIVILIAMIARSIQFYLFS